MAYTVPTVEPTEFSAGDSLSWDRALSDYTPADGWTLSYVLSGAHESPLVITATASDDGMGHEVRVTPATTAEYTSGRYNLVGFVTHSDGSRYEVYRASCYVHPDAATATPDLGHAERMLAAIEAVLEGRIPADVESYQIAGRAVNKIPLERLSIERSKYAEIVRRQRGGSFFRDVKVQFGRAS